MSFGVGWCGLVWVGVGWCGLVCVGVGCWLEGGVGIRYGGSGEWW